MPEGAKSINARANRWESSLARPERWAGSWVSRILVARIRLGTAPLL